MIQECTNTELKYLLRENRSALNKLTSFTMLLNKEFLSFILGKKLFESCGWFTPSGLSSLEASRSTTSSLACTLLAPSSLLKFAGDWAHSSGGSLAMVLPAAREPHEESFSLSWLSRTSFSLTNPPFLRLPIYSKRYYKSSKTDWLPIIILAIKYCILHCIACILYTTI